MKKLYLVQATILAVSVLLQLTTFPLHSQAAAGDLDLSFDPGTGINGAVNAVAVQPDGKVIIGGQFTTVRGLQRTNLARLNADGSGDSTFFLAPSSPVYSLIRQSDGKLLVGREFELVRCLPDGSPDTNFNANVSAAFDPAAGFIPPAPPRSIIVQPDGKIIYAANGVVLRLNSDGTFDGSFATLGPAYVYAMALQFDGKILISALLDTETGPGYRLARLNTDGSFDNSFGWITNSPSGSIVAQQDGKLLVSSVYFGTAYHPLVRLNSNGTLDTAINFSGREVYFMAPAPDGKVIISAQNLARLNSDGTPDTGFQHGPGGVRAIAFQTDGTMIIGGYFNIYNGKRVARLNANGSPDTSFNPGEGINRPVSSIAVQTDGKILLGLGTSYAFVNGTNVVASIRLNTDGSLDRAFVPAAFHPEFPLFPGYEEYWTGDFFAVQPDGKVFVGGGAAQYQCDEVAGCLITSTVTFVYRVHANGSLDTTFDPLTNGVAVVAVQPDGRILIGGGSFSIQGANRSGVARLNTNATLDTSFNAGTLNDVQAMTLQPDAKVLIAGTFTNVNGISRSGMARLNSDGALDTGFNPEIATNSYVWKMAVQPDGKVLLVVASLTALNERRVVRLNSDGSVDDSFHLAALDSGSAANASVFAIASQPDGKVLIGGDFMAVDGLRRTYVARLYGHSSIAPSLSIARSNAFVIASWPVMGLSFQLQASTDLSLANTWSAVGQPAITNGARISVTVPASAGSKFFRLKSE